MLRILNIDNNNDRLNATLYFLKSIDRFLFPRFASCCFLTAHRLHRFNCLRRLTMAKADFTVMEPEDLVAASAYNEYNILVTNELRMLPDGNYKVNRIAIKIILPVAITWEVEIHVSSMLYYLLVEKQRYEMVVIVSKDVRNIWDVKGKRFCHPGLDTTDDWTNAFSTVNFLITTPCLPCLCSIKDIIFLR